MWLWPVAVFAMLFAIGIPLPVLAGEVGVTECVDSKQRYEKLLARGIRNEMKKGEDAVLAEGDQKLIADVKEYFRLSAEIKFRCAKVLARKLKQSSLPLPGKKPDIASAKPLLPDMETRETVPAGNPEAPELRRSLYQ
jgi:hypothetical protein